MRALLSVAHQDGLIALAQALCDYDVQLFSAADTLLDLQRAGIPVQSVDNLVHPSERHEERSYLAVLHDILALKDLSDSADNVALSHSFALDVVVMNFRPFSEVIAHSDMKFSDALEKIELARIALLRAAANNVQKTLVLVRPGDYRSVMQEWQKQGSVSLETRRRLAAVAFEYISAYDAEVAGYLRGSSAERFQEHVTLSLDRIQSLRYGENPHQQAAFYRWTDTRVATSFPTVADAEILHGTDLSYNNLLDLDAALMAVQGFTAPCVCIVKHTNPCGLACDDHLLEAYKKAHAGDSVSAFGGVIGCNRTINQETAHEISTLFYEAIIAPEFSPEALHILFQRKNLRLLATHRPIEPRSVNSRLEDNLCMEIRTVGGGLLLQTPDVVGDGDVHYSVVAVREPTLEEITDLMFAWKVVRCVKSNAIVLAHKLAVIGVGAGQMNRVTSVQLALEKAGERARGAVLASDAFFPFADGIEAAARAGITAIIQPGGSARDDESIRAANHYAIAMVFTGQRHFRH